MPKREVTDVEGLLFMEEREKAICVSEDGGKTKIWLPKSQIEYEDKGSGLVNITIPLWLASEKKLAGY